MKKVIGFVRSMKFGMILLVLVIACSVAGSLIVQQGEAMDYVRRYPHQKAMQVLSREDERCIDEAHAQVKTEALQDRMVNALSDGQQQRAYIAMALAQDTQALFLDEPTASLDISVRFEIMDLIRQLNAAGKTIVMVLHDLELAVQYSDHLILLEQGRVICTGSTQELIASGMLDRFFDIRARVIEEKGATFFHFSKSS